MEDLEKNSANCKNVPGFIGLWLVYDYEVVSNELTSENTRSVVLDTGCQWGDTNAKSVSLNTPYSDGCYTLEINGIMQSVNTDIEVKLACMCRKKFVAKLLDRSEQYWLAGTKDEPLNFDYERVMDDKPSGNRVYRFRLYRQTTYPVSRI